MSAVWRVPLWILSAKCSAELCPRTWQTSLNRDDVTRGSNPSKHSGLWWHAQSCVPFPELLPVTSCAVVHVCYVQISTQMGQGCNHLVAEVVVVGHLDGE